MRSNKKLRGSTILAGLATLALAASPAAAGKPDHAGKPDGAGKPEGAGKPDKPGNGKGKGKGVAYVFKGTYAGDSTVDVTKTNKHARDFDGQTVVFDLSAAKVSVADTSGDGVADLGDVVTGDSVVVKAKLPKGEEPVQPIAANRLVDQTNPAPEEDPVAPEPAL